MLAAAWITQLWHLVVLWRGLLGMGSGIKALVLGAGVSNRWFATLRGLVMGLLTASAATGQLACLPVATCMLEHWGWRSTLARLGLIFLGVMALVWLLMRNRPSDLGQTAFGEAPGTPQPPKPPRMTIAAPFTALREPSALSTFWLLLGNFFICGLSTNRLVQTHFISLCGEMGLEAVPAASVLAMIGIFHLFGTIASGRLSDRYDSRKLLFWYCGLRGLSLLWLLWLPHAEYTL